MGSIPGLRRSLGVGNCNPLQYSWPGESHEQESLMGYIVHGVTRVGYNLVTKNKNKKHRSSIVLQPCLLMMIKVSDPCQHADCSAFWRTGVNSSKWPGSSHRFELRGITVESSDYYWVSLWVLGSLERVPSHREFFKWVAGKGCWAEGLLHLSSCC